MSIGKKLLFCAIIPTSIRYISKQGGKWSSHKQQVKLFDEWTYNYRQQDYCDGRLGHHILAACSGKSFVIGLWMSVLDAQRNHVPLSQQSLSQTV